MLHLPCRRHRPTQVNCVFNVSALPVFPAWGCLKLKGPTQVKTGGN